MRFAHTSRRLAATIITCSCFAFPAAADLFTVTSTGGGTITASDSDVLDLLEDAIERNGVFAPQSGQATVAELNYGGVSQAVRVSVNAAETSATLEFPLTGFSRVFTGSDADDLQDQIEDYLKEDGASDYASLLKALNERSVVGVFDGNPFSSTALFARGSFHHYGLHAAGSPSGGYELGPDQGIGEWYFTINPSLSAIDADGFDGGAGSVSAAAGFSFNQYIGLTFGGTYAFVDYEDTDIFHGSGRFGVPINIVPENGREAVHWQVTPFVSTGFGASEDAAAGGAFTGLGVATHVGINLGLLDLELGGQYIDFDGYDIEYDDFEFETDLDQQMFSVGGLTRFTFNEFGGPGPFIEAGLSYHTYLEDAAVEDWLSPEASIGWFLADDSIRFNVGYRGILGDNDFDAHSVTANLGFGF